MRKKGEKKKEERNSRVRTRVTEEKGEVATPVSQGKQRRDRKRR